MELKVSVTKKGKIFESEAPDVIKNNLISAMYEGTQFLERKVKLILERLSPNFYFTGTSSRTIKGEVVDKGMPVLKGIVGHQSKYGDVIFGKGRTAGKAMPPAGSLIRWMEVKFGMERLEALKKEFIIRRKIGKKGFKGSKAFDLALDEGWPALVKIFERHGLEIARLLSE